MDFTLRMLDLVLKLMDLAQYHERRRLGATHHGSVEE